MICCLLEDVLLLGASLGDRLRQLTPPESSLQEDEQEQQDDEDGQDALQIQEEHGSHRHRGELRRHVHEGRERDVRADDEDRRGPNYVPLAHAHRRYAARGAGVSVLSE